MSPMALVLVGQTELFNCVLPHLDRSETERYIRSHLAYAGGKQ